MTKMHDQRDPATLGCLHGQWSAKVRGVQP